MYNPLIYALAGAVAYAVVRRIYVKVVGPPSPNAAAFDSAVDRQSERVRQLTRENAELRRQLAEHGVDTPAPSHLSTIQALLAQGRKIEAIKEYRLATGVGLKEAKDAVEGIGFMVRDTTPSVEPSDDRIKSLVLAGNKIAAIRDYRQRTGADLRTAKEYVEALARDLGR